MVIYDRVKTRSNPPVRFRHHWQDLFGGQDPADHVVPIKDDYTRGVSIPNFWKRKKAGLLLPHTDFDQFEVVGVTKVPFDMERRRASDGVKTHWFDDHVLFTDVDIYHAVDSSFGPALVQGAAAAIANSGFDAATSLAELKKTVKMVGGVAKRLRNLSTKKGRQLSPRELHQNWLEGRYGWRVLAYEIADLNDAIRNFDSKREIYSERTGFSYKEEDSTVVRVVDAPFSYGTLDAVVTYTTKHSVRGAVGAAVKPARFIVDPLQTGWELVPFSFVADWVFSVGTAISAGRLLRKASATTASYGTLSKTTGVISTPYVTQQLPEGVTSVTGGAFEFECERVTRVPTSIKLTPYVSNDLMIDPLNLVDIQALYRAAQPARKRGGYDRVYR